MAGYGEIFGKVLDESIRREILTPDQAYEMMQLMRDLLTILDPGEPLRLWSVYDKFGARATALAWTTHQSAYDQLCKWLADNKPGIERLGLHVAPLEDE